MSATCDYMHAYYDDDWGRCPPECGPVRQYRHANGGLNSYCDDAAIQVREDGFNIELVEPS